MRRHGLISAMVVLSLNAATAFGGEGTELPANKLNAAKLAGLAGFVNIHCEKLRTDGDRFKTAVQSMDVDPAELERNVLLLRARSYIAAYQKDVPASCSRADELFGRAGRIIPGVFVPR